MYLLSKCLPKRLYHCTLSNKTMRVPVSLWSFLANLDIYVT